MSSTDIPLRLQEFLVDKPSVGIVLGIMRDGRLAETHAAGTTHLGRENPPNAASVFRIASMTKSFTAAAVLLLRERGLVRLDDPVSVHVPWMPDTDITVRDLLTMNAGYPTDDPWGDRHEPTPLADFDALIAAGVRRTRAARSGFEYSNLSYALLGRVIANATGREYTEFVTAELLRPLGMDDSVFDHRDVDPERLVQGYHDPRGDFVPEPPVRPGAFSPMGGLHSSVRDLVRWMSGLLGAWHGETTHPLSIESRREMQNPHNFARMAVRTHDDGTADASSLSYGYGLLVEQHSRRGRFVLHSGGYPGFGSHMRWHPDTGLGVVALSNRTYAAPVALCEDVLGTLVDSAKPLVPVADRLWPETRAAMDVAERLLRDWDDALADEWFAHNMDPDQPRDERRRLATELHDVARAAVRDDSTLTSRSAAHANWRVCGSDGSVTVELLLSPDPRPRIQYLEYSRST